MFVRNAFLEDSATCEVRRRIIEAYPGARAIDLNAD